MTSPTPAPARSGEERSLAAPGVGRRQPDGPEVAAQTSGWGGKLLAVVGVLVSLVYLANPGWGVFELLPDNIPGAGNLDEFFFSLLLVACLQRLGINILPFLRGGRLRDTESGKR